MVNLLKNLRPFQNYIFKIQWEIHFLTLSNTDWNPPKKIQNRNMDILIWNLFLKSIFDSGSGQTENTQICVFVYFQFDHFPKSKMHFKSRFEMRISIFLF